jgi:hypothetical protein
MKTLFIVLFAFVLMNCTSHVDPISPCSAPDPVNYFIDVYPIIDRTCALPTCHVNGSQYGDFKNADEVKKVANSGKLEFMIVTRQMPAGITKGKTILTDCEITIIKKWINNGAPVN